LTKLITFNLRPRTSPQLI